MNSTHGNMNCIHGNMNSTHGNPKWTRLEFPCREIIFQCTTYSHVQHVKILDSRVHNQKFFMMRLPALPFHISCHLYLYYICEDHTSTPAASTRLGDTRQGSLTVQRPHPTPLAATTLPLLYPPDYCYPTNCICCVSCSCPCPAPRVYPLPARTSRRLRGGRRLAVTVTSLAGGHHGP